MVPFVAFPGGDDFRVILSVEAGPGAGPFDRFGFRERFFRDVEESLLAAAVAQ